MDITVQREVLLKPLQAISGIVDKKQAMPLLSNVLLTLRDDKLLLIGTDLEIELIGFIPIEAKASAGTTTVSARKLFDICRALPENSSIRINLDKNYLSIRAAESHFMLNTLPGDTFPTVQDVKFTTQFTLKQSSLRDLFTKTYFAMGQQDVRHFLNGTFLDIKPNSIKCVAADGHRLALATIQDAKIGEMNAQVIVPRKSVLELVRLLASDQDLEIVMQLAENYFRIITSDFIFTSKVVNAQYPDYSRLVPRGTINVVGEREAIKQALARASILSSEKLRGVRFQLAPSKLAISANNTDLEEANEVVAVDYEGDPIETGFNVIYLLDAIASMTAKTIRFVFSGPNDGVVLESAEDDSTLYVIMPMRI